MSFQKKRGLPIKQRILVLLITFILVACCTDHGESSPNYAVSTYDVLQHATTKSQCNYQQPLSVKNIALLLPLSGQSKMFTHAIKQGFTAAHKSLQAQLSSVNCATQLPGTIVDINGQQTVQVYDTNSHPLPELLAQAKQNGANMIIGPLLKNEVEQLYKADTWLVDKLNILALNQPATLQPRSSSTSNICYFSLAPEDEARAAANHIAAHGWLQPLLLLPIGTLGDRVAQAFTDAWQQAGGGTVLVQRLGSTKELKHLINSGAGIKLTGMPLAASDKVTNLPLTITATKQDNGTFSNSSNHIDAVYIIATPDELAFIKPMIDMNLSTQVSIALYASSRSYNAYAGLDYRLEMEGLEFSDIPLLTTTGTYPALLAKISAQCGGINSLFRLYAMGMDARMIANNFSEIRHIPGFQLAGITGTTLSATPHCVIQRQLSWFKYHSGQLIATS